MPAAFDLKQVGQLFNDTIDAIRDDADVDALEPDAVEWLKGARYRLMREIEQAYYSLERARDTPMSQPAWALDPTEFLHLSTTPVPGPLKPYIPAMLDNLRELLTACGFHARVDTLVWWITVNISFPAKVTVGAAGASHPKKRTLHIDDEFSMAGGKRRQITTAGSGLFTGGNFARLVESRRDTGDGAGSSRKRRRGSRVVKREEEDDDDDEGNGKETGRIDVGLSKRPGRRRGSGVIKQEDSEENGRRLRSATRASSSATLRSASEPQTTRRSTRKRVKNDEV
ncbi:hypothetical protein R3P38DRAFT_3221494 [Favolaschia claudopus]|uniref:Uncharacterized protein n=1 Tax=Favolaschia claudopus TaxID=2862362 RepID=A0AAW0A0V8_9AGAR